MLRAQGCYDGAIDGVLGDETRSAVTAFQYRHPDLEVTGSCDRATWIRLADTDRPFVDEQDRSRERLLYLQWPMLQGVDVEELQLRLSVLGFHPGRIDGIFGPGTADAVGRFQRNTGIIEDSVCGPDTRSMLVDLSHRQSRAPDSGDHQLTVSAVIEGELLRCAPPADQVFALGADPDDRVLGTSVHRALEELGRTVHLIAGPAEEQATRCNDLGVRAFVHLATTDSAEVTIAFYGRPDGSHHSLGGRLLATSLSERIGSAVDDVTVTTLARQSVRLTQTRCPAVEVELPRAVHDRIDGSHLAAGIEEWLTSTEVDEPQSS